MLYAMQFVIDWGPFDIRRIPGLPKWSIANTNPSILELDNTSIPLVLSCHMLPIAIYGCTLEDMYFCTAQTGKQPNPKQAASTTPILQFGTFILPQ